MKKRWMQTASVVVLSVCVSLPTIAVTQVKAAPYSATFTIDTSQERAAISPYIYGTNPDLSGTENFTLRRFGGNRTTGYNWENNASNAGSDYLHQSDDLMCNGLPAGACTTPGAALTAFHDRSISLGTKSAITIPLAGYVARDKNGPVSTAETAPSSRWDSISFSKGSPYTNTPNTGDGVVYVDEEVNFLLNRYGNASGNGVWAYLLDNEPALWSSTHPRIHPTKVGAAEYKNKSVTAATMVKNKDPNAQVFGGEFYGFNAYLSLQDAPDWNSVKGSYSWYLDYYLDQMKLAGNSAGKRLLDVLSLHYYSEAQGGGSRIVFGGAGNIDTQKARVQAPRTLWDPTYLESSWIATSFPSYLPIIPRVQQSINTYYPGTKTAITEYSWGGESHVSGGIATADGLGIFGKYGVHAANFWQLESQTNYVSAAFKLFRNYNGGNATYGDTKVKANTSDVANSSVYASQFNGNNGELHIIVMNKNFTDSMNATFNITSGTSFSTGEVWGFDSASSNITQRAGISGISGNSFTYSIPALSAYHIILKASGDTARYNFENNSVQGFVGTNGSVVSSSTTQKFAGNSSLKLAINGNGTYFAQVSNPANLSAGSTVTFRVWVPSGASLTSIQPFVQDFNWTWYGSWRTYASLTPNAWNTITVTLPANAVNPPKLLGVEVVTSAAWNGSVYIDSINW